MFVSMFQLHMRSLIELKQTGTVVEYTAAFWERLHRVLELNSDLNIQCFVDHYVNGLSDDIQAAVRSRSPSSITGASCLARIREDEIVKDTTMGADKLGNSYGLTPTETVTDVSPERSPPVQCSAGHGVTTIDVCCFAAPTQTMCSTECPSQADTASTTALALTATSTSSTTTIDVFPKLAALAEINKDLNLDTISVAAETPATCSPGGQAHGREGDSLTALSLVLWTMSPFSTAPTEAAATSSQRSSSVLELETIVPTRCSTLCFDSDDIGVLTSAFQLDVIQRGSLLRPSPWPSFVAEHTGTTYNDIAEPPPSAATASRQVVISYSTLSLLPCMLEAFQMFSPGSGYTGTTGHCKAAPHRGYVSRVVSTLVPALVTEDISDEPSSGRITVYQWFIVVSRATTKSASTVIINTLCISSVLWCLDDVLWTLGKYWSVTQVGLKDFITSLLGVQVPGHSHVWRHCQCWITRELSKRTTIADVMSWLLHMGNTSSCLRALNLLRGVNKLHGTIRIAETTRGYSGALFAFGKHQMCLQYELLLHLFFDGTAEMHGPVLVAFDSKIWMLQGCTSRRVCGYAMTREWKLWPHTQFVQKTASVFFAVHSEFLHTSAVFSTELHWKTFYFSTNFMFVWYMELATDHCNFYLVQPAQLDYILPPAKPPDSSEGCATMVNCESCDQFNTRGVKEMFTYAGDQLPKILEIYLHSLGKIVVKFSCSGSEQSYRLEESVAVVTFLNIILGNDMEHHQVGQKPHGIIMIHTNDSALQVVTNPPCTYKNNSLAVCCTCGAMSKNPEADCVLHILFPSSYRGAINDSRAALYKSCASDASVTEFVPDYLAYIVAAIASTGGRASTEIQMLGIVDIWPSPELLCGTHHDQDLMLLGSTHRDLSFEGASVRYDNDCDHSGYAAVAIGQWSAVVVRQVQTPWDPGGFVVLWYLISGLRASRILRRRECHTQGSPAVTILLGFTSVVRGLGPTTGEWTEAYIPEEQQGKGIEELNRVQASRPLLQFLTSCLVSHLLAFADSSPQTLLYPQPVSEYWY